MIDRTVAQYHFLERLGAGGMGEIYKARDTRLNRIVAIKALSQSASGDAERRRRFALEAQAASALNHPNIVTVHDIVSDPDADAEFLVMEFVAGKTLAELIPSGGLRVREILQYATQVTDALSAAHAAGIIHRDIKPTNIMVTDSGLLKVLDFGLAKVAYPMTVAGANDATQTVGGARLTIEGSIVGTVSYMSPEQAEGKTVDPRSDIFSFGVVLYEMVTGSRAFGGDTALSTLTAILRDEVRPMAEQTPDVPPELVAITARCLRKKPDERWQTMRELHGALRALKQKSDSGILYHAPIPVSPRKGPRAIWLSGVIVLTILLALAGWWLSTRRKPAQSPAPTASAPADFPALPPPATPPPETILTNDKIVEMIQAKVPASIIISHIRSSKTRFDLSTEELIRLTSAGVPEAVIQAMGGLPITSETRPADPSAVAAPPIVERVISVTDGSPISIEVAEDIPADAQPGMPLRFTVTKDFLVGSTVVVAKGAAVTGEIMDGAKKRFLVMGSKMTFRLIQLDAVNGQKLNVRATSGRQGDNNRRRVETGTHKKTKEAAAAAGSEYVAYVEGDQTVSVRN